jgi:Rod binding domain-containing protein
MPETSLTPVLMGASPAPAGGPDTPARVRDAAQQFESLLLEQILRSARESGSGWLNADQDSAGDCATEYAEQQLAVAMAQSGGLGIAKLVAAGLEKK